MRASGSRGESSRIIRRVPVPAGTGDEDGPLEDMFTQVLYVCAVAGLGRLRVISVDGSKIWADAAKEANRTLEGLRKLSRRMLEEAAAADGECDCEGHGHGEAGR